MKYNCKLLFLISILVLNSLNIYALEFKGDFKQGSFILGKTKPGAKVYIDKRKIRVSKDGYFAFGLDRDRKNDVRIKIINNTEEKNIVKKLKSNIAYFKKNIRSKLISKDSITPIQTITVGCPKKVKNIQERALYDGLFIQAIRYPTVPKNNDLLRINITSGHTKPQISKLLTFLSRV